MRKVTVLTTAFCLLAGASFAADTYTATIVLPDGNVVPAETPLAIEIHAIVTNDSPGNQGLAYFSTDFTMSGPTEVILGDALILGTPPTPMDFFARDLGYDAGYGGTPVGNDVLQAGGALNTIGNDPTQEPFLDFPSAEDIPLDVAHSAQIVLSGTITFPPGADGDYTLSLESLLANVISQDAVPGSFAIYPVEAANTVAGDPVVITVGSTEICIVHGNPDWVREEPGTHVGFDDWAFSGYIDPAVESTDGTALDLGKTTFNIVFSREAFGDAGGGAITAGNFSMEETGGGGVPTILSATKSGNAVEIVLDRIITLQEWTTIVANVWDGDGVQIDDGGNEGEDIDECARLDVGFLPTDVNNDDCGQPVDLNRWIVSWNNGHIHPPDVSKGVVEDYTDLSRNGDMDPIDVSRLIAGLKGLTPFTRNWRNLCINSPQP